MLRRLLCLVLPLALLAAPGCTFVGAAVGGGVASSSNHRQEMAQLRRGEPVEEHSILPGVVVGAGVGLIVDALLVSMAVSALDDARFPASDGCCYGVSND